MQGDNSKSDTSGGANRKTGKQDSGADSGMERSWKEIYAELDSAEFPAEFMAHRDQGTFEHREQVDEQ